MELEFNGRSKGTVIASMFGLSTMCYHACWVVEMMKSTSGICSGRITCRRLTIFHNYYSAVIAHERINEEKRVQFRVEDDLYTLLKRKYNIWK